MAEGEDIHIPSWQDGSRRDETGWGKPTGKPWEVWHMAPLDTVAQVGSVKGSWRRICCSDTEWLTGRFLEDRRGVLGEGKGPSSSSKTAWTPSACWEAAHRQWRMTPLISVTISSKLSGHCVLSCSDKHPALDPCLLQQPLLLEKFTCPYGEKQLLLSWRYIFHPMGRRDHQGTRGDTSLLCGSVCRILMWIIKPGKWMQQHVQDTTSSVSWNPIHF